jgi:hypothetical protein
VIVLFKPLGPTQQTLKLTMDNSKAKIPKATLLLELVQPEALSAIAPVVPRAHAWTGALAAPRE